MNDRYTARHMLCYENLEKQGGTTRQRLARYSTQGYANADYCLSPNYIHRTERTYMPTRE